MNISKRVYPYPVLYEGGSDYSDSSFEVERKYEMYGVGTLKMTFDFLLDNKELLQLIENGSAKYTVHVECSKTSYRIIRKFSVNHVEIDIPLTDVNQRLEVVALLLLEKDIDKFSCDDWSEDFEGLKFSLSRGSVLAYKMFPDINVEKKNEGLSTSESIIAIYKRISDDKVPMEVRLDDEKIKIGLGKMEYETYQAHKGNPAQLSVLNAMIIFPALVYVFAELRQNLLEDIEYNPYDGKAWYTSLVRAYANRGMNFEEEIMDEGNTPIKLAQDVMERPVEKAIENFNAAWDMIEQEEE